MGISNASGLSETNNPSMISAVGTLPIANGGTGSATGYIGANQLLFILRAADMTSTADQQLTKVFTGTNYLISNITAVRKTGAYGVACLGGFYTGATKSGDILVAATQSWLNLTGAAKVSVATLAALVLTNVESAVPYLSLSTGNTGALTADIFIYGYIVD